MTRAVKLGLKNVKTGKKSYKNKIIRFTLLKKIFKL